MGREMRNGNNYMKNKCLNCKKVIKGIGVIFYSKHACYDCYNAYMNNNKIINKGKGVLNK